MPPPSMAGAISAAIAAPACSTPTRPILPGHDRRPVGDARRPRRAAARRRQIQTAERIGWMTELDSAPPVRALPGLRLAPAPRASSPIQRPVPLAAMNLIARAPVISETSSKPLYRRNRHDIRIKLLARPRRSRCRRPGQRPADHAAAPSAASRPTRAPPRDHAADRPPQPPTPPRHRDDPAAGGQPGRAERGEPNRRPPHECARRPTRRDPGRRGRGRTPPLRRRRR